MKKCLFEFVNIKRHVKKKAFFRAFQNYGNCFCDVVTVGFWKSFLKSAIFFNAFSRQNNLFYAIIHA